MMAWFPIIIRLRSTNWSKPEWLNVNSEFNNIVSAHVNYEQLQLLQENNAIRSIEESREVHFEEELTSGINDNIQRPINRPNLSERGDSALIGIIDSGIDILHEAFQDDNGDTRILAIWNQKDPKGPSPKEYDPQRFAHDYGTLITSEDIKNYLNQFPDQQPPGYARDPRHHGSHVASIAAGRGVGNIGDGIAPEAKIICVIPNMITESEDPKSLGYSVSHIDALYFLRSVSEGNNKLLSNTLPIAINVSLGMNAGAHDGTSSLETAFETISESGDREGFVIVKSAGNELAHQIHARVQLFQANQTIQWQSSDDFRSEDYFEAWYNKFSTLEFRLLSPKAQSSTGEEQLVSDIVSEENPVVENNLGGNICHLQLTKNHPDSGDKRLVIRNPSET